MPHIDWNWTQYSDLYTNLRRNSICFQFPENSFVQFPKNFHNF